MADDRDELAAESDRLLNELRTVQSLEAEKRDAKISTPKFHDLADRILDKSREIFRIADDQERLGERIPTSDSSIEDLDRET